MSLREETIDWNKVDEITLALMHLTTFEEHQVFRSWKGHDWEVLKRLHARGWIDDPVNKAKSVLLTDEGRRRSLELFASHFEQAV
jgi:hypothetical protein